MHFFLIVLYLPNYSLLQNSEYVNLVDVHAGGRKNIFAVVRDCSSAKRTKNQGSLLLMNCFWNWLSLLNSNSIYFLFYIFYAYFFFFYSIDFSINCKISDPSWNDAPLSVNLFFPPDAVPPKLQNGMVLRLKPLKVFLFQEYMCSWTDRFSDGNSTKRQSYGRRIQRISNCLRRSNRSYLCTSV